MARLLVDGMNVIGSRPTGWWRDRAGAGRDLVRTLGALAVAGHDVTVVLEGRAAAVGEGRHQGVRVLVAPGRGRDAGDDRVVAEVAADPDPASLEVVTSDRRLAARVRALGATVSGAGALRHRLGPAGPPPPGATPDAIEG